MLVAFKILKPKSLIIFSLAMLVTLTLNSIAFNVSYGFTETITEVFGGVTEKVMLAQKDSKIVYTSRVPLSLAENLNRIKGIKAQAVTLTPTIINGKPIVFRGVTSIRDYTDEIIEGSLPKTEGFWFIVGEEAYKRLNLKVGEITPVGSPYNSEILLLKLVAVYRNGDLKDWEAVTPISVGRTLANLPEGMTNLIEVEGIAKDELENMVTKSYSLTINHIFSRGRIYIFDSEGVPVESIKIDAPGSENLILPFGYYRIAYQSSYLTTNVTSLLLTRNYSLNLTFMSEKLFRLKVVASKDKSPLLYLQNGSVIQGDWLDDAWLFYVPGGLHELKINGSSYQIPIVEDTVFNPIFRGEELNLVTLKVFSQKGEALKDYFVTIRNVGGEIVFSTISSAHYLKLLLPFGVYKVEVLMPPYKVNSSLKVPGEAEINLKLPALFNPYRIPLTLYKEIGAYTQLERSDASMQMIIGLSIGVLLISTIIFLMLSIIAVFTVQKWLYNASKENLRLLIHLGAGKLETLRILGLPTLATNLVLGFIAALVSFTLNLFFLKPLTVVGYGITVNLFLTVVYVMFLSVVSWLYSNLRLHVWAAD